MPSPTVIPVGGYANVTQVISAAGQTAVIAEINKFLALIPNTAHASAEASPPAGVAPLYDKFSPELANALRVELAALIAAIDAAPTS